MPKCPYCQEEIKEGAVICKHCHADLSPRTFWDSLIGRTIKLAFYTSVIGFIILMLYAYYDLSKFPQGSTNTINFPGEACRQRCESVAEKSASDGALASPLEKSVFTDSCVNSCIIRIRASQELQ